MPVRICLLALLALGGPRCYCEDYGVAEDVVRSHVTETSAGNGWSVNYPKQRKLFYMAGQLWVFYSDGRNIVTRTSPDGQTWSEPTAVTEGNTGVYGHRFAGWHDGTHFHYAFNDAIAGQPVLYRRGLPREDGTLGWSGPVQIAYDTPPDESLMYPKVIADDRGRPWVAFMRYDGGVETAPYDAVVIASRTGDGSFVPALGFPFALVNDATGEYPDPVGVPLREGRTFWVYNRGRGEDVYYGRLWDGTGWEPEERVTREEDEYAMFNLVAEGDDVHLVAASGKVVYRKRTWGQGWGAEHTVTRLGSGHTSLTLTGPDRVLVTWLNKDEHWILYRERDAGSWSRAMRWVDASEARIADMRLGINSNGLVTANPLFRGAVVYTTGTQAPFDLWFAGLPAE